jgi:hypothetical protein
VGAQSVYADTVVDNTNNSFSRTLVHTVVAINADGSYISTWIDPSGNIVRSFNIDHTVYPTTLNNNSVGQTTISTVRPYLSSPFSCTESPHGAGAPSPLPLGQAWAFVYSENCGNGAEVVYTDSGSVVGVENLVVPAGSFNAYKIQSVRTSALATGTVTETTTVWRNAAANDTRVLKEESNYNYSGLTVALGVTVKDTKVLTSMR